MIRFFRSSSVRLALGYASLFIASSLLLLGLLWWQTASYLDRETDAVILANTRAIGDRFRDFGLAGALETIRDRVTNGDKEAIYLLVNPAFEPLAGNLSAWPQEVGYATGWSDAEMLNSGQTHATRLLNVSLPGGFHLLIGRDVEDRAQVRTLILNGLAWAILGALVLAVLGGIVTRRALSARVDLISRTTAAIVQGDLGQRVPEGGSADEFDQLSRTINRMLEQIQKLLEGVRNVSNAVAHDLRTPLAEARARLEGVLRREPSKDVSAGIEQAIDDIDRLIGMSNALLRLAEIDSGVRRSGFQEVRLGEIVTDVVELYQPTAAQSGVEFRVRMEVQPTVNGDPSLLAQAIGNLVDNAIKYAPAGSPIDIQIISPAEDLVEIIVGDKGPGIPDVEKVRATERFYRGDSSRGKAGVGLGLSVVASIARLHAGALILADNDPGLAASLVLTGENSLSSPRIEDVRLISP
jgi:signal transduction histidine kinase